MVVTWWCEKVRGFENFCKIQYLSNIRIFFKKWHNEVDEWYWCCWIPKLKHQLGSQQWVEPFCYICALVGCQCQPSPCAAMSFTRACSISQIFENCNQYIWLCIFPIALCFEAVVKANTTGLIPTEPTFCVHQKNCSLRQRISSLSHVVFQYCSKVGQFSQH